MRARRSRSSISIPWIHRRHDSGFGAKPDPAPVLAFAPCTRPRAAEVAGRRGRARPCARAPPAPPPSRAERANSARSPCAAADRSSARLLICPGSTDGSAGGAPAPRHGPRTFSVRRATKNLRLPAATRRYLDQSKNRGTPAREADWPLLCHASSTTPPPTMPNWRSSPASVEGPFHTTPTAKAAPAPHGRVRACTGLASARRPGGDAGLEHLAPLEAWYGSWGSAP